MFCLLEAGCLCCTIADSLHETLADLNFRKVRGEVPPFERVIIETTGLSDPAPILNTLLGNRLVTDHYRLDSVVVTVDAQHALAGLDAHPELAKQIAVADRLVITKGDLAAPPDELIARLDRLNPHAARFHSRDPTAALAAFAPASGIDCRSDSFRSPSSRPAAFPAARRKHPRRLLRSPATAYLGRHRGWWRLVSETFGDRMLRCKGLLEIADTGDIVFVQGVQRVFHSPERLPDWPDADHRSRLVCITRDVDEAELRLTLRSFDAPAGTSPNLTLTDLQHGRN